VAVTVLADTMFELVRCSRCSIYSMIDRLPQFPGVNAPHLATGVQPWVFFKLSSLGKIAAKGVVTNRLCDLLVQPTVA